LDGITAEALRVVNLVENDRCAFGERAYTTAVRVDPETGVRLFDVGMDRSVPCEVRTDVSRRAGDRRRPTDRCRWRPSDSRGSRQSDSETADGRSLQYVSRCDRLLDGCRYRPAP
jgi:hypothetical protein